MQNYGTKCKKRARLFRALILVLKFVGGALIRTILSTVYRKDFEND